MIRDMFLLALFGLIVFLLCGLMTYLGPMPS